MERLQIPSVNSLGEILEQEGFVSFGESAYNQLGNNCYEIVSYLASMFGYKIPTRKELTQRIYDEKRERLWGKEDSKITASPANIVVRFPDNPNDVHVTFEIYGREYNYGPSSREGFTTGLRIPIRA